MILLYLISSVAIIASTGGYYLSKELKKYTDIGTVEEFKKLKESKTTD